MIVGRGETQVLLLPRILHTDKRRRERAAFQEMPHPIVPLPIIDAGEQFPEYKERIDNVNVLLAGTYGLSLAYDEACRKLLGKPKKQHDGLILPEDDRSRPYTLESFSQELDAVSDYSMKLSYLATAVVRNEPVPELVAEVAEKTNTIFSDVLEGGVPKTQVKPIDEQLGIKRFLFSEVNGINVEAHDVRNIITSLRGYAQLRVKKGQEKPDKHFQDFVRKYEIFGQQLRDRLLSPIQLYDEGSQALVDALRQITADLSSEQHFREWTVSMPSEVPGKLPHVSFNDQMLSSIFENALRNSQKGRKLLEEHFVGTSLAVALFDLDAQTTRTALRYLHQLSDRLQEMPTMEVDFATKVLRRRPYLEIVLRDNGIGNDHRSGRRTWRRNFSVGESDWGNSSVNGTGVAMGAHRARIKQLYPHTHADLFLRNRTDGKQGAEVVVRLPEVQKK